MLARQPAQGKNQRKTHCVCIHEHFELVFNTFIFDDNEGD